uniref:TBC1 domain family member 22B n=1 Tax=Cacopsylla melanoneura TaxID=428564 RepID=A0A8D8YGR5_9HEMI
MNEQSMVVNDNKGFWKKNSHNVPGRPSPKKSVFSSASSTSSQSNANSSFQAFQASISDAWVIDDDEFCNPNVNISKKVAQSAALNVINNHKTKQFESGSSARNNKVNESESSKIAKFNALLNLNLLNLEELRSLAWSGIPNRVRPDAWRLLAGYLPTSSERRQQVLERKRTEYWVFVKQYYDTERDETYQDIYRQIHIDIPRMSPLMMLFQQKLVQEMFERILFIWAIRHPASGYVQGINDLVTPFFVVFLQEFLPVGTDLELLDISTLPKEQRDIIEADSFCCLSKFLDGIQDNYIFAQLGIQQKVNQLKDLIQRIDTNLHNHLLKHGVDYLQFSFRWMNNLLTREVPLRCSIRLWDTYLAESDDFAAFQLYVCAAFLLHWRQKLLRERDFQGLMLMLQNLPTSNWSDHDIGVLVAEAYRFKVAFADAPNHLSGSKIKR